VLGTWEGQGLDASFGQSVADAGDFDGDGTHDLLIGAPYGTTSEVFVYSGATHALLHQFSGMGRDALGVSVTSAGDLNGDGFAEVLLGAPNASPGGKALAGSAFLYAGSSGSLLQRFDGNAAGDQLGTSVATIGDQDADGVRDLLIGIPYADHAGQSDCGRAEIRSGTSGALLAFQIGSDGANLGALVASAGHIDDDDLEDLLVGAPRESTAPFTRQGACFVFSGASGLELLRFAGEDRDRFNGNAGCSLGDIDGDGHDDVLLGYERGNGGFAQVVAFSGKSGKALLHRTSEAFDPRYGEAVAMLEDGAGAGVSTFVVGAPNPTGLGVTGKVQSLRYSPFLGADQREVSTVNGTRVNLDLNFLSARSFAAYRVLLSTSGAGPTTWQGIAVPLTFDAWTTQSIQGSYPFTSSTALHGNLDVIGRAAAQFTTPSGLPVGLWGRNFWMAALAVDGQSVVTSIAVVFRFTP
jgi:hypothetical protein